MLPKVPWQILDIQTQFKKFSNAWIAHVEACNAELFFESVEFIFVFEMTDESRETFERFCIEAHHLADFARSGFSSIRNDVCSHGCAQCTVSLIDVLNGAFPLITTGQIKIDVGPFATFFGQKSFEEQFHLYGIDRRDAQRITNSTVCSRTAALYEDIVLAAEPDDIPDDQKITFETKFFDQRQFAFELTVRSLVVWPKSFARAFIGALTEE